MRGMTWRAISAVPYFKAIANGNLFASFVVFVAWMVWLIGFGHLWDEVGRCRLTVSNPR